MTWIDDERLLLQSPKAISILNIETEEEEEILLDYWDCQNISFNDITSDPFNPDRIVYALLDYYYEADGSFWRRERLGYYDIGTGENGILELE